MNIGFRVPKVDTEPVERKFDVRVYVNFVWRHWLFIAAITALALLIAVINLVRATPLYTATTQVLLVPPEKAPIESSSANYYQFNSSSFIENQLAILRSDSLLRRVVLKERSALLSPTASQPQSTDISKQEVEDLAIRSAINSLRGALATSRSGRAQALDISITWTDPARAAELANAVADAYVVDQLEARFESAKSAEGWLSDRLVELRRQLRDSEEAVAKFRTEHGLSRSGPTVTLNDQQLTELNSKLIAARTDAAEKKTRLDFLTDVIAGKRSLDSLPDSLQSQVQSASMQALRGKLADVSQREADLLSRYNSRHPAVVNVEAEKRDIERSIAAETQRIIQAVKSDYALAQARLQATEQAMREATGQGELDNEDAVKLRELERTAAVNKSLFEDFLQKAKVTAEQSTFQARDVRVIMPAQKPGGPSFPQKRRALMMALLAGIGLGVAGALAMEMLNAGFTTRREIEDALGLPVLASVPRADKNKLTKDGKTIPLPFYQLHFPLSPFSEAMRTLRSGIHMSDVDQPPKVIHVTSSRPGEGKTTIALSLAISAASSGLKVVLVDADLRHPSSSRFFNLEKERGLVDFMMGAATFENVLRVQKDVRLGIIPAGSKSLNPPDILASERMKQLISHLKQSFDYVVLDSPPVGPVIDPIIVSGLADKTVFVVQWGATPRELTEISVQQISTHKRIAGVVLSQVNERRAKKYGSYHYGKAYDRYYSES